MSGYFYATIAVVIGALLFPLFWGWSTVPGVWLARWVLVWAMVAAPVVILGILAEGYAGRGEDDDQ